MILKVTQPIATRTTSHTWAWEFIANPSAKPYLKSHAWAKQYGDLGSLKTGTSDLIIINNPAIVHELFDNGEQSTRIV